MSEGRNEQSCGACNLIIHSASATAAAIGGGLAQFPGADAVLLYPAQTAMICLIGQAHGFKPTEGAAAALLGGLTATIAGRTLSQILLGWIPGLGNVINALTASALTEAIGWAAHHHFATANRGR